MTTEKTQTKSAAKAEAAAAAAAAKLALKISKDAAVAAAAVAAAAAKNVQNGVTAPAEGTTSAGVWAFADSQSAALGAPAKRAEVLAACVAAGYNPATSATQFGRWCKFNGLVAAKTVEAPAADGDAEEVAGDSEEHDPAMAAE